MKWALISNTTNIVEQIIVWDGKSTWTKPDGVYMVKIDGKEAGIGYTYDPVSKAFTEPPEEVIIEPASP